MVKIIIISCMLLMTGINTMISQPINIIETKTVDNLIEKIKIFNKANEQLYRKAILKYCHPIIKKEELDSLIIVGEPVTTIDSNYKIQLHLKDLLSPYALSDIWDYYVPYVKNNSSLTKRIILPLGYNETNNISFRLYTPSKKHKYNIVIINPNERRNHAYGDNSRIIEYYLEDLEDTTDLASAFYNKFSIPFDDIIFSIDYNLQDLPNCIIYNSKIYSIPFLKITAIKEGFNNYTQLPKDKWDKCEINSYLSDPSAFKVK